MGTTPLPGKQVPSECGAGLCPHLDVSAVFRRLHDREEAEAAIQKAIPEGRSRGVKRHRGSCLVQERRPEALLV